MSSMCISSCRCCVLLSVMHFAILSVVFCVSVVCHSRGTVQIESTYPASPEARPPSFLGSQPCVPVAWLAERLLLAGDIESNPGPRPTLKTLSHTRTQPPTLSKCTGSSVQLPWACPPPLSLVHAPPRTPTSIQPLKTHTSSPLAPHSLPTLH